MKRVKVWKWSMIGAALFVIAAPLVMLTQSKVEMTPNGVHTRLLLPAGPNRNIGIHLYSGTGDAPRIPQFLDGPIVRPAANGQWAATWFCENAVHRQSGSGDVLQIDCAGKQMRYPVRAASVQPPSKIEAPARMLVLSDIEGNAAFLDSALRELGVQDADGRWAYGTGHLVIAGDAVDRGRDVFAVLWRLYALSLQAAEQGGAVHLVLGNHEQYMLRGNMSRANREHIHTTERMGGFHQAFAADTVIGAWLRRQPVILQAGKVVVTHGGIGPQVAASSLSSEQLNEAQRRYWQGPATQSAALDAVLGPAGLTQYRGYFEDMADDASRATPAQVTQALEHFGADTIVVGHSPVEQITPLYQGRVYAIDVNTHTAASEALLFEHGVARIIPLRTQRMLAPERPPVKTRPLNLADAEDWRTLGRWLERSRTLSQLSYPY
jgi:Calcineurin-like phosphoesterase